MGALLALLSIRSLALANVGAAGDRKVIVSVAVPPDAIERGESPVEENNDPLSLTTLIAEISSDPRPELRIKIVFDVERDSATTPKSSTAGSVSISARTWLVRPLQSQDEMAPATRTVHSHTASDRAPIQLYATRTTPPPETAKGHDRHRSRVATRRYASCRIDWGAGKVVVHAPKGDLDDAALVAATKEADKVGVDAPFGWPEPFADAIAAHRKGGPMGTAPVEALRLRETDIYVWKQVKRQPFSVSTDRIAVPALRAARVLRPRDRIGRGKLVEVYPAAALKRWGFSPNGYKGDDGAKVRCSLVEKFCREIRGWCSVGAASRVAFFASDHMFDAFICALVARAHAIGLCDPVPDSHRVAIEGWIALPLNDALKRLEVSL